MKKVLWVKFGWSEFYRGGPVDGNFSHLAGKGNRGHEAYNFEPAQDGTYYCYVPPQGGEYAPKNDDQTGWTVVCLAKHPKRKGVHIVGWKYCITSTTAYFVPPEERTMPFSHPSVRQGKYSFLAVPGVETSARKGKLLRRLKRRLKKLRPVAITNPTDARAPDPGAGPAKLLAGFGTPEHRKKVEKAAEKTVKRHYKAKGFSCKNVTSQDLERFD